MTAPVASPTVVKTKTAAEWAFAARRTTIPAEAKVFAWYAAAKAHDERGAGAVNPFDPETEKDLREHWWWFFSLRSKAARKEAEQVAKADARPRFTQRAPVKAGPAVRTTSRAYAEISGAEVVDGV